MYDALIESIANHEDGFYSKERDTKLNPDNERCSSRDVLGPRDKEANQNDSAIFPTHVRLVNVLPTPHLDQDI